MHTLVCGLIEFLKDGGKRMQNNCHWLKKLINIYRENISAHVLFHDRLKMIDNPCKEKKNRTNGHISDFYVKCSTTVL